MSKTYLGDGLYVADHGYQIELSTERENGQHFVCLDPVVVMALLKFLERTWGMKIVFGE